MPDPGLQPPYFDPSQYPNYLDVQRKQMLAQMLMGNAQQANQTPADWDSMRVVPKKGLLGGLLGAFSGAMAGKAMKGAQQAEQKYFQGMFAPDSTSTFSSGAQGASPPGAPSQGPGVLPAGMSKATAAQLMQMLGPQKFAEVVSAPTVMGSTEWQNAMRASGGNEQTARQLLMMKARKEGTIEMRPGGAAMIPNAQGAVDTVRNPTLATGEMPTTDAAGNVTGTRMLPGHLEDTAALEQATETAKEQAKAPFDLMEIPMGGGSFKKMPLSEYLKMQGVKTSGANPAPSPTSAAAPAASTPAAPTPKSYFPTPASQQPKPEWLKQAPKVDVPNTPGQTTDAYHQKILEKAADKHTELADKYGNEADLADARIAFNKEALTVLDKADTGPLSDELTKLRSKAEELGVPAQWIPGSDTVQSTQELKKFLLRNPLLSLKPTFGGRPAAAEFQVLANEASPSPTMLKGAIRRLVELDNTQAGYSKQRADDYSQYHQAGGDPFQFERYYAKTHPFAKALEKPSLRRNFTPEELEAEMQSRGILKKP